MANSPRKPLYKRAWFIVLGGLFVLFAILVAVMMPSKKQMEADRRKRDSTYLAVHSADSIAEAKRFAALPKHSRDSIIAAKKKDSLSEIRTSSGIGKSRDEVIRKLKSDGADFSFHSDKTTTGEPSYVGEYSGVTVTFVGPASNPTKASILVPIGTNTESNKGALLLAADFANQYSAESVNWMTEQVQKHDFTESYSESTTIGSRSFTMGNVNGGSKAAFYVAVSSK